MARPKEFERGAVLQQAIGIFADHGYEGTSTEMVLTAMGISRQSMYDTFGDKRRLYLEALQRYITDSVGDQLHVLNGGANALDSLKAVIEQAVAKAIADPAPACLGVSAVCEFGHADPEVTMLTDTAGRLLFSAFERRLVEARAAGDIAADIDATDAANFLRATLAGLKIAARGGASPDELRGIARTALRSLR
jgi:TetR/AcrR family transcriptional repressor of nem operon